MMIASKHAHVDTEVFEQLRQLEAIRPGTLTELTSHFLEDGEAHLQTLESASADQLGELVTAAHSLKGCSGMIGAKELARLSAVVELEGRAGNLSTDHVGQLRAAFDAFVPFLRDLANGA